MSELSVENFGGFVTCKQSRCEYSASCDDLSFELESGTNILYGDIDAGGWCFSYALSMYPHVDAVDIIIDEECGIEFNGEKYSVYDMRRFCCYLDETDPQFASDVSVEDAVRECLCESRMGYSTEEIRELFHISAERFQRTLSQVGNEKYSCMAAIAFASGKDVFCFPWISKKMTDYYWFYLIVLCRVLSSLGKIVVLPTNDRSLPIAKKVIEMPNITRNHNADISWMP